MESRTTGTHDGGKLHERSHGERARAISERLERGLERPLHSPLFAATVDAHGHEAERICAVGGQLRRPLP